MKNKIGKYLKEALLFFLAMTIFANLLSLYRSSYLSDAKLELPHYTKTTDKNSFTLKENKPLLVYFWATWCPVCKAEASNIQAISKKFKVLTIAVKSGSDGDINDYMKSNGLDFEVLNDTEGYIAQKYGVHVFPTTIIYDKDKNTIFSDVGYTSTIGLWIRMIIAELYL